MKKMLSIILAIAMLFSLVACGTTTGKESIPASAASEEISAPPAVSQPAESADTSTDPSVVTPVTPDPELSLKEYAGAWVLDGEKTEANLKNVTGGLQEMFGSSLRNNGASLTISEDGSISYYVGAVLDANGSCTPSDTGLTADVNLWIGDTSEDVTIEINVSRDKDTVVGLEIPYNDEILYWTKDNGSDVFTSIDEESSLPDDVIETYELVRQYPFHDTNPNESDLSFTLNPETLVDAGDYYLIGCTLNKPVTIPKGLPEGPYEIVTNDLTGETETIDIGSDGYPAGDVYYCYSINDGSDSLTLFWGSDDRVDSPFAEGTLAISKDAVITIAIIDQHDPVTPEALQDDLTWYNGVSFNSDGIVTELAFYGD